ncbi:MAG: AAA family ATPase [Myxococcota bacterium]
MARLRIDTLIAIEEFTDGTCLAYPVVDPELSALGTEENAVTEVRLFLAEALSTDRNPVRIARFAIPEDASPYRVEIPLPEHDLPARFRREPPFSIDAIVVPHGSARWVLVPSLRHTVYVAKGEDLSELVTHELKRHLRAIQPGAWERAALLPPVSHRIERTSIFLDRPEARSGSTRKLRSDLLRARQRKHASKILRSIATPLHADPRVTDGPPIVGRDEECAALDALLRSETRHAVLLVGERRVGKTSLLHHWLRLHEMSVYQTSGAQLIAGMSSAGQWQARIQRVMESAEVLDAILYFDDLRDLFDRTSAKSGVDIPGAMKPFLEEGRVRIVGELDDATADLLASREEGFFQSFHTVRVPPSDRRGAAAVLTARSEHGSLAARPRADAQAAILSLCERYLPYLPFPGKAAELFDQLLATAERPGVALDAPEELRASDVYRLFSLQTGIPEFLLREDRALDPDRLRSRFQSRLVGQESAVGAVADTLCVVKAGLQPGDKPLATFLFVGPTGVGKTELARALAEVLYGAEDRLVRFDMSEYADGLAAGRLIGDGQGEGLLTRAVREQPFAVVLLDEIEKAHPVVFDLLLQVTGEGRLTDARGRVAYFHNTILILTSNIGASHRLGRAGFGDAEPGSHAQHYTREVQRWFRPEFVNRLDRIIPFTPLDRTAIDAITELTIARLARRRGITDRGHILDISPAALALLAEGGFDEAYGARALRRHLENALAGPLAALITRFDRPARLRVLAADEPRPSDPIAAEVREKLAFVAVPIEADQDAADPATLAHITKLRREVGHLLTLPSVEIHHDEMQTMLAQLSAPRSKKAQRRAGAEIARMQKDFHALETRWRALNDAKEELWDLEELALTAFYDHEAFDLPREDVDALRHRFRMALLGLLLDADPQHAITVLCQELDAGRTLNIWLITLLKDLERRGWRATGHIYRDPSPSERAWPPMRTQWGPPRSADELIAFLEHDHRGRAVILLRVSGNHVGTHLAVEAGLHRHLGVEPIPSGSHHAVQIIAMRASVQDDEWDHPCLEPTLRLAPQAQVLKQRCVRWTDVRASRDLPENYVDVPLEAYWAPENADELALRDLIRLERDHSRERAMLYPSPLDAKPDVKPDAKPEPS